MISTSFNLGEFLEHVKDKNYKEILALAEKEGTQVERLTHRRRQRESNEYIRLLWGLVFFLIYRKKPEGVSGEEFQLFRPICESLVRKDQMQPDILKLFDKD